MNDAKCRKHIVAPAEPALRRPEPRTMRRTTRTADVPLRYRDDRPAGPTSSPKRAAHTVDDGRRPKSTAASAHERRADTPTSTQVEPVKGRFGKAEDDAIHTGVKEYGTDNWAAIVTPWPLPPGLSIGNDRSRYGTLTARSGAFSREEDEAIRIGVETHGVGSWVEIVSPHTCYRSHRT